jgi:hypothetical protein
MKRIIIILVVLLAAGRAWADEIATEAEKVADFDKLRTPDSPAFVILGVSPTEIQRPTTPKALAVALSGFVTGQDPSISIPESFALEVAPYWLFSHPDLDLQTYRDDHLMRPIRTFSISVGTSQTARTDEMEVDHTDSDLALGVRTTLFQTGDQDACTKKATDIAMGAVLSAEELKEVTNAGPNGAAKHKEIIERNLKRLKADSNCVALITSSRGFSIDLAGAIDIRAIDSKLTREATSFAGYSVWTNASYDRPSFSGVAMGRLAGHDDGMDLQHVLDAGLRGIFKHTDYALSAEGLVRRRFTDDDDKTTYKVDVTIEYQLADSTWLSLTFGKSFAFAPDEVGQLFSLANVQFGVGKPTLTD